MSFHHRIAIPTSLHDEITLLPKTVTTAATKVPPVGIIEIKEAGVEVPKPRAEGLLIVQTDMNAQIGTGRAGQRARVMQSRRYRNQN